MAYYSERKTAAITAPKPVEGLGFVVNTPVGRFPLDTAALLNEAIDGAWPNVHDKALSLVPEAMDAAYPKLQEMIPGLANEAMSQATQQLPNLINSAMAQAMPMAQKELQKFVNAQVPILEKRFQAMLPPVKYFKIAAVAGIAFAAITTAASIVTIAKAKKK